MFLLNTQFSCIQRAMPTIGAFSMPEDHSGRTNGWSLIVLLFLLIFSFATASSQVHITASHADIGQLTIGDIDFENFGSQHWFFTLNVSANPPQRVKLFLNVDVSMPPDNFPDAIRLVTESFDAPLSISNLDLGKNGIIKTDEFRFTDDAKDKIKDIALATGKVPAGTYTFRLKAVSENNPFDADSTQIIITNENYSRVELLTPSNNSESPTSFPQFQWLYDGDRVELSIYEKFPYQQGNEEAFSGTPIFVIRSGEPGLPENVRSFQYPTSGVRALEPGKRYVWAVRGLVEGTGGNDAGLNSEIWQFTVATSTGDGALDMPAERIVETEYLNEQLNDLPGVEGSVLTRLLSDYRMTGEMYLNGQRISLVELKQLLDELLANPDRIIEIKVLDQQ